MDVVRVKTAAHTKTAIQRGGATYIAARSSGCDKEPLEPALEVLVVVSIYPPTIPKVCTVAP